MTRSFQMAALALVGLSTACVEVRNKEIDPNRDPTQTVGEPPPAPPAEEVPGSLPQTKYCVPDQEKRTYPQNNVQFTTGRSSTFVWSEGGGCLSRPLREAWAAGHNQPLMVWSKISESSFSLMNTQPAGASHLYKVLYTVKDFITVQWTMLWTHAVAAGTFEAPKRVTINYERIDSNSSHMAYWAGSIVLDRLTDDVTAFWMRNEVKATQQGPTEAGITLTEVYAKFLKGAPDWNNLNLGKR